MAQVKGNVGFGDASDYESLPVHLDKDDVRPEYIPAVTREVPVLSDVPEGADPDAATPEGEKLYGVQLQDPETGAPLTKTETVTPGRYESLEEAFARALGQHLSIEDIEQSGISSLTFEVNYSGTVTLEYSDYELEQFGEDNDPDDITSDDIRDAFSDDIVEAIKEDIGWNGDWDIDSFDAE